ncbi:MAG: cyclase family protein [Oscillospiraceae bacterium]|nr:cyclase family protein [Oscillospiraceae bacterium]
MKVIDISQELFSCAVYPGDPAPERKRLSSLELGDPCNLTALSLCAHNGTHIDAPNHFIRDGKTVDRLSPEVFVGPAWVAFRDGDVTAADALRMLDDARAAGAGERLLIGGAATVTPEAAEVFASSGLRLIGNESQTFGSPADHREVHRILLGAEVVLLEGIRLGGAAAGRYFLFSAPLNLGGSDGAPCRAMLIAGME